MELLPPRPELIDALKEVGEGWEIAEVEYGDGSELQIIGDPKIFSSDEAAFHHVMARYACAEGVRPLHALRRLARESPDYLKRMTHDLEEELAVEGREGPMPMTDEDIANLLEDGEDG